MVAIVAVACSKSGGKASPPAERTKDSPPPVAETSASAALIVRDGALQRFSPGRPAEAIAKVPATDVCDVDATHDVVWLLGGGVLRAYDRRKRALETIADGVPDIEAWAIRYTKPGAPFPEQTAGTADGMSNCIALVVTVAAEPTIGGVYIGEGDREVYCGEYDEAAENIALFDEYKQKKAAYDKVTLNDRAALAALAPRQAESRTPVKLQEPKTKPSVSIDRAKCEEVPDDCGSVEYLGGRIWRVTTGNSRGDFFHEDFQLYDAVAKQFWNPETGARSAEPFEDGSQMFELTVAPDGRWAIWGDEILSLERAHKAGKLPGQFCGWD